MSTALATLTNNFAARFGIESNQQELVDTLKATAFKGGNVTDAQMTALMLVAQQYSLNPWTREIYAFPDKGGIVPVVGVDGWSRIMNDHPQFDGMEFRFEEDSCTCIIYRKDRSHAISATEYLAECRRDTQPWKSHPRRMLRHKAMIQCARLAFGFGGIYDQDEAERIVERDIGSIEGSATVVKVVKPEPPTLALADIEKYTKDKINPADGVVISFSPKSLIERGEETAQNFIDFLSAKYVLDDDVVAAIQSWTPKGDQQ